jgi:hypothetical protein
MTGRRATFYLNIFRDCTQPRGPQGALALGGRRTLIVGGLRTPPLPRGMGSLHDEMKLGCAHGSKLHKIY